MAQLSYVIKDKVPEQFLTQIFTKLVYNACVEIKEKNDYIFDIQPIAIIANPNHEEMYFDVAEIFLAEGNLEKATEILEKIFNHKHSERAQKLNVNIGMAKIDRISIEDEELNALDPQKWLGFAQLYFNFKRYQIERDAFIIAAKICWKQGYLARALEILSNCTLACPIIAHKNSEAFKEYLKTDGEKDFNIALEILTA